MENLTIIVIALIIFCVLIIRESARKQSILVRMVIDLRAVNHQQSLRIRYLEGRIAGANHPQTPVASVNGEVQKWKRAWARQVLLVSSEKPTRDELRTARRNALKSAHPDAGGNARRMRDIEEALIILDYK